MKDTFLDSIKKYLDKLDDDISEIYEELYKIKVVNHSIISLLVKNNIFTEDDLKEEMRETRKRIRQG